MASSVIDDLDVVAASNGVPGRDPLQERRHRLAILAFFVLTVLAIGAYLAYIAHFGVNVVWWDEWNWVPLVANSMTGHLTLGQLWSLWNGNRMLFPNLIAIVLARATRWSDFAFFYTGASLLIATYGIIVYVFYREIKDKPLWWLFLPPVVFTLAQYENMIWAFQIAWYLALCCLVAATALLSRDRISIPVLVAAIALGGVASFSLLQGLLVWPAGLVALSARGRSNWFRFVWLFAGIVAAAVFFAGVSRHDLGTRAPSAYVHHLGATIQGFLVAIGSVIPNVTLSIGDSLTFLLTEFVGFCLLTLGCGLFILWLKDHRPGGPRAFATALIAVGILFNLLLIPTRLYDYVAGGVPSRYVTFNLPLILGIFSSLILIDWKGRRAETTGATLRGFVLVFLALQVLLGVAAGIWNGQYIRPNRLTSADILTDLNVSPDNLILPYLFPISASYVHRNAAFLEKNGMNVFGKPDPSLHSLGIVPGGELTAQLPTPQQISAWLKADPGAAKAWHVLSAVYATSDGTLGQFSDSPAGTRGLISWAAYLDPSPTADLDHWIIPANDVFLEQYNAYYIAWSDSLTWPAYSPLPIPKRWRQYMTEHPLESVAWDQLSGVYDNTTSLRSNYPRSDPRALLRWAASSASNGIPALAPLHGALVRLAIATHAVKVSAN